MTFFASFALGFIVATLIWMRHAREMEQDFNRLQRDEEKYYRLWLDTVEPKDGGL